jgi:hypothetical protein
MGILWLGIMLKTTHMEKKLFVIDGYRIWAFTYDEAYESYLRILKF